MIPYFLSTIDGDNEKSDIIAFIVIGLEREKLKPRQSGSCRY